MASTENISRKNTRSSAVSTVIGIALVLFMLGSLGLILLNAKKLSEYVRENVQLQVFFKEAVSDSSAIAFQQELNDKNFTRTTVFVSKTQAAEKLQQELGEDFVDFLGYNPLSSGIDLTLNAEYASPAKVEQLARNLRGHYLVEEVVYSPDLVAQLNQNINRIALIMLGFSALLLIISIALLNNTIRLSIYSKRFVIKTMQLVGATPGFIRRPFLFKGMLQGILAAIIALALIAGLIYFVSSEIPEFFVMQDVVIYAQLFGGVVVMGIIISWISTYLAVRKYIRLKSDEVY